MKQPKVTLSTLLIVIITVSVLGGCSPQKKLIPPPGPDPVPPDKVPRMYVKPTPQKVARSVDIASDISRISETVPGVGRAYTVVLGNVSVIGVQPESSTAGTSASRKQVVIRAERDPRIDKAFVTSDPTETATLRKIADSVRKGKPVTDYMDELTKIIRHAST